MGVPMSFRITCTQPIQIMLINIICIKSIFSNELGMFKKIVNLNNPWGSSFINNEEIIITEKSGKIKLVNVVSKKTIEINSPK